MNAPLYGQPSDGANIGKQLMLWLQRFADSHKAQHIVYPFVTETLTVSVANDTSLVTTKQGAHNGGSMPDINTIITVALPRNPVLKNGTVRVLVLSSVNEIRFVAVETPSDPAILTPSVFQNTGNNTAFDCQYFSDKRKWFILKMS